MLQNSKFAPSVRIKHISYRQRYTCFTSRCLIRSVWSWNQSSGLICGRTFACRTFSKKVISSFSHCKPTFIVVDWIRLFLYGSYCRLRWRSKVLMLHALTWSTWITNTTLSRLQLKFLLERSRSDGLSCATGLTAVYEQRAYMSWNAYTLR